MKKKPNPLFIIISLLVVAAGAYWYFFVGQDNDVSLTPVGQSSAAQARFQALAGQLMGITFDTRIFDDPRFMGLVDLSTPITPETPGRLDPFAPLGTGAAPVSAAQPSEIPEASPGAASTSTSTTPQAGPVTPGM